MNSDLLQKYTKLFSKSKLRVDRTHGSPAPHKHILLLSILQMYKKGQITDNRIYITPELVSLFKVIWGLLVISDHKCNITLPFYHLKSSPFWKLIPKREFQGVQFKISFSSLNAVVDYVEIDEGLSELMLNSETNSILTEYLLEEYFPQTKYKFNKTNDKQNKLFEDLKDVIRESPAKYIAKVKRLIKQNKEEDIYLRGAEFKREIPKIYNNTCCISKLKIDATLSVSMIDACHIVPFSESFDDTITNGIALCPNLHRAFDRGLISISDNYQVLVKPENVFKESNSDYSIRKYHGKRILLPNSAQYYPSPENLQTHRNKHLFYQHEIV